MTYLLSIIKKLPKGGLNSPIFAGTPAGIGTVLAKPNGCRGFIGPVPPPTLDEFEIYSFP
jgi:hypothetical protein